MNKPKPPRGARCLSACGGTDNGSISRSGRCHGGLYARNKLFSPGSEYGTNKNISTIRSVNSQGGRNCLILEIVCLITDSGLSSSTLQFLSSILRIVGY
ncbi:FAD/NADP-binding domain-containing protein [Gigaspora margarita]|uniref:FAD/NADP-binding domain-containing protein n=1 Tax=Gigaspora margarita TaxID=4874 RepID=A0A8H3XL64_GIGMA|nr:FAD/NADP-binding domain-containing protein [Gigaspora margarita]